MTTHFEKCTFGGGCFWGVEDYFLKLKGVDETKVGFMGGQTENPTYQQVCRGDTGHIEVVQLLFIPGVISYKELLEHFWKIHDPTTPNRQGPDIGTQYQSVIFYENDEQKMTAQKSINEIDQSGHLPGPVVTKLLPAKIFYPAENYHQKYFCKLRNQPPSK